MEEKSLLEKKGQEIQKLKFRSGFSRISKLVMEYNKNYPGQNGDCHSQTKGDCGSLMILQKETLPFKVVKVATLTVLSVVYELSYLILP